MAHKLYLSALWFLLAAGALGTAEISREVVAMREYERRFWAYANDGLAAWNKCMDVDPAMTVPRDTCIRLKRVVPEPTEPTILLLPVEPIRSLEQAIGRGAAMFVPALMLVGLRRWILWLRIPSVKPN